MAYNRKYYLPFSDILGDQWELELAAEDYTGDEHIVYGTGTPVVMNDPNRGKGKFTPIKGTKLDMNFLVSSALKGQFRDDFGNATDRQFRAILNKRVSEAIYRSDCKIDQFDVTAESTAAKASISITNSGAESGITTECDVEIAIDFANITERIDFKLIAAPGDVNVNSQSYNDEGYEIASTYVDPDETAKDIRDRLIQQFDSKDQELEDLGTTDLALYLRYKETDYVEGLNTSWRLYVQSAIVATSSYLWYYFTSTPKRPYIEFILYIADEISGNSHETVSIARHEYIDGEDNSSVASDLADKINDLPTLTNVYFPAYDLITDVNFSATISSGNTIEISIEDVGDAANINTRDTETPLDETFFFITKREGSEYTWSKEDFSGGTSSGDTFEFVYTPDADDIVVASVTNQSGDTASDVVRRLVQKINDESSIFNAVVDETDDTEFTVTVEDSDADGWTHRFDTSGNSTLTPATDTDFEADESEKRIKWIGWVLPGIYKENRLPGYAQISLTAVDGLGDLKNIPFTGPRQKPFELKSFMNLTSSILQKTGFLLDIYEAFNLWELGMDSSVSPLKQVYEDTVRLNGRNCYEVLTEILKITKSELIQKDGHWELRPKDQLIEDFDYRVFSAYGNAKGTKGKTFQTRDVGGKGSENLLINANAEIEYAPVYRQIILKQNYGFVDQLLKFPAFSSINDALGEEQNNSYPWQLRFNDVIRPAGDKVYKNDDTLIIVSDDQQDNKFYFSQKFQLGNIIQGNTKNEQFEWSIRYKQKEAGTFYAENFDIMLVVTDGTNTRYLNESEDTGFTWVETETKINLPGRDRTGDSTFTLKFNYPTAYMNFSEADAEVRIYQPDSGRVFIKSIEIKINALARTGTKFYMYHQENVNELTYESYEDDINLGDVPELLNAEQLYKNALYRVDEDGDKHLTATWVKDLNDPTDSKSLIRSLQEYYLSEYARTPSGTSADRTGPPSILSADIYGPMELRDVIRLKTNNDKLFALTGGKWDIKKRVISGEWEQVNIDTSALTIITENKSYSEDSSGSNSYTTASGSEEDNQVDLSNYLTEDQIESLVLGKTGSFLGSDMSDRQIQLNHGLGYEPTFLNLFRNGKQINPANFEFDTEESNDHVILTLSVPFEDSDRFKYRMI